MAHALGMEYLYNGQYGVSTDMNGLYYMRARYYDQSIKRFINRDVLSGDIGNSQSLNRFSYVQGNPVSLTDPFGLCPDGNGVAEGIMQQAVSMIGLTGEDAAGGINWSDLGHTALDLIGIVWDGADIINAVWYGLEGNYAMAAVSAISALPFVGSLVGGSAGLALKVIGHSLTFGMAAKGTWEAAGRAVEAYQNGTLSGWNFLDVGINALGMGLSGRAAFSEGRKLANRIAASETGQKIAKRYKAYLADNRGCVDLEALGLVKSKGGSGFPQNRTSLWGQEKYVTEKGLNTIKQHLSGSLADDFNDAMISRLENAYKSNTKIGGADLDFYAHEIYESTMMRGGMNYNNAHKAAKTHYNATEFNLYHPEIIKQNPKSFNNAWFEFWGIERN